MTPEPINKKFLFGCLYIFLVTGALVLMTSSILTYLMLHYQLNFGQGGLLLSLLAIGSVLSNFLSGALAIRIGRKPTLILAAVCYFVSYGGLSLLPPLPVLYVLLFVAGLGWGITNNMVNFLMALATNGDSSKIVMVHTSYSAGALLAPLLVGLFVGLGWSWRIPVVIMAGLSLILIMVIVSMPISEAIVTSGQKPKINLSFLKRWRFYLYLLMFFSYVGIESSFYGWLVSYLTTLRAYSDADAQVLLSALWVSILAGRLAVAFLGRRLPKAVFLLILGGGILAGSLLLILAGQPLLLTTAVIVAGLGMSAFYGLIIANASDLVVESTLASGLLLSFGGLGATVLPLLVGILARQSNIVTGLTFMAIMAGFLLMLSLINFLTRPRAENNRAK